MIYVLDIPENRSPTAWFSTIIGDSMRPILEPGWAVRVETVRTPEDGDIVVVLIAGKGRFVGYWQGGERPLLRKENPAYEPMDLNASGRTWSIQGVVEAIIWAPIHPRENPAA
jgi:SOS-response transcriptional repressor LexA